MLREDPVLEAAVEALQLDEQVGVTRMGTMRFSTSTHQQTKLRLKKPTAA